MTKQSALKDGYKKDEQQRSAGFSLIELMIVAFIMAMVAGALVINFREGDKQRRVNLMRDTVISAFRTAQSYTLAGRQIPPEGQALHVRGDERCNNDNAALSYWLEFATATAIDIMAEDRCGAIMRVQRFDAVAQTRFIQTNPFVLATSAGNEINSNTVAIRFLPPFGSMSATIESEPLPDDFGTFVGVDLTIEYIDGSRPRIITIDGISGRID